jgi:spoIIIJ-associated protein
MFTKKEQETIKKEVGEFFNKMGFEVEIEVVLQDETLQLNLKSPEPQVLIGERGNILICLQKVLKTILGRKLEKIFYLDLDINDYKKKKTQYLKEMARKIADEVVLEKQEKILPPMSPYERRIVHLELADRKNITTQSVGREPERRIIIKPYP